MEAPIERYLGTCLPSINDDFPGWWLKNPKLCSCAFLHFLNLNKYDYAVE